MKKFVLVQDFVYRISKTCDSCGTAKTDSYYYCVPDDPQEKCKYMVGFCLECTPGPRKKYQDGRWVRIPEAMVAILQVHES